MLESLEHGEQSPYQDTASVQQLTDSIPLDFEQNLKELEELYARFIAGVAPDDAGRLKAANRARPGLSRRCSISGGSPELSPGCASSHALGTDPHHSQLVPEDAG